jgi:hypothetical protein
LGCNSKRHGGGGKKKNQAKRMGLQKCAKEKANSSKNNKP